VGASLRATREHFDDEWTPELAKEWTEAYTLVAEVMVAAADEAAELPAWWDADVVGHERRGIDVAVLQVGRGRATSTGPASRCRSRPTSGPGCGATTRRPTRRGPTG